MFARGAIRVWTVLVAVVTFVFWVLILPATNSPVIDTARAIAYGFALWVIGAFFLGLFIWAFRGFRN